MTPEIVQRSFSNDQYCLDKVFYSNCYKIKGLKEHKSLTLVDIGAHAGYFSICAQALGIDKIYCFEPFILNYHLLLKNISNMGGIVDSKIVPYPMGVYTKEMTAYFKKPKLLEHSYFDFLNIDISYTRESDSYAFECLTLDKLLTNYVAEKVNLLKISIGYAEFDILNSSKLENVDTLFGETTLASEEEIIKIKTLFLEKGFIESHFLKSKEEENKYYFWLSKDSLDKFFNLK